MRCTETSCQFPAEYGSLLVNRELTLYFRINREVSMVEGHMVGECTLMDKKHLSQAGLLTEERLVTLRYTVGLLSREMDGQMAARGVLYGYGLL